MIRNLIHLCAFAITLAGSAGALAQPAAEFPSKPIRLIVPHPAGGAADVFARLVGEKISVKWKQPVLIENRPSVGGNLGAELVFKSEPDGYTMLAGTPGPIAINGSLFKKLNFDQTRFVAVSILTVQ